MSADGLTMYFAKHVRELGHKGIHELISKRILGKSMHELRRAPAFLTGDHTHTAASDDSHEDYEDELIRADLNGDGVIHAEDFPFYHDIGLRGISPLDYESNG